MAGTCHLAAMLSLAATLSLTCTLQCTEPEHTQRLEARVTKPRAHRSTILHMSMPRLPHSGSVLHAARLAQCTHFCAAQQASPHRQAPALPLHDSRPCSMSLFSAAKHARTCCAKC